MRSILLSILIHILLLSTIADKTISKNNTEPQNPPVRVSVVIADKPSKEEINDTKIIENKTKIVVKKKKNIPKQKYMDHKCEKWYGGVGIQYIDSVSFIVGYIGKGYPANRAGIIKGDLIINDGDLIGEPGTNVTVRVMRGSNILTFHLIREKICTKDMKL